MARVIGWDSPFWDGIERHSAPYSARDTRGMIKWLCQPEQPGFFCWWNALDERRLIVRLVGFSDPNTALAFKMRWG